MREVNVGDKLDQYELTELIADVDLAHIRLAYRTRAGR
jgi:hypothetical protein